MLDGFQSPWYYVAAGGSELTVDLKKIVHIFTVLVLSGNGILPVVGLESYQNESCVVCSGKKKKKSPLIL